MLHLRADGNPGWIADGQRRVSVLEAIELHGENRAATVIEATRMALNALPNVDRWRLRAELLHAEQIVSGAASHELSAVLARLERVAGMCPSEPDVLGELSRTRERVRQWRERIEREREADALLFAAQPGGSA